jgi:hypothetical protein
MAYFNKFLVIISLETWIYLNFNNLNHLSLGGDGGDIGSPTAVASLDGDGGGIGSPRGRKLIFRVCSVPFLALQLDPL